MARFQQRGKAGSAGDLPQSLLSRRLGLFAARTQEGAGKETKVTDTGKQLRMARIFDPSTGKAIVMPMDHPLFAYHEVLEDPRPLVRGLIQAGATAFLMNRGTAKFVTTELAGRAGLILRVSIATAFTQRDTDYAVASTVEEALRLGADAVAPCVFLGSDHEKEDLRLWGFMADECDKWGMPIFPEVHPPAELSGAVAHQGPYTVEAMRLCVRISAEIGADFIKTWYTGDAKSYREVLRYSLVPVLIAGGPPATTPQTCLQMVKGAMEAGAGGICIGRKVWGWEDPFGMCRAVTRIVRDGASVEEALQELEARR